MNKEPTPTPTAQRQRAYTARQKELGRIKLQIWTHPEDAEILKALALQLKNKREGK